MTPSLCAADQTLALNDITNFDFPSKGRSEDGNGPSRGLPGNGQVRLSMDLRLLGKHTGAFVGERVCLQYQVHLHCQAGGRWGLVLPGLQAVRGWPGNGQVRASMDLRLLDRHAGAFVGERVCL